MCWGPDQVGVRRLRELISRLGPDSAIARAMGWSWDDMREMTATLIEVAVNQKRKKGSPRFRYPRPEGIAKPAPRRTPPKLTRAGIRAAMTRGRR